MSRVIKSGLLAPGSHGGVEVPAWSRRGRPGRPGKRPGAVEPGEALTPAADAAQEDGPGAGASPAEAPVPEAGAAGTAGTDEVLLAAAREEARGLLAEAIAQAERVREEARSRGYDEGREQGLADGRREAAEYLARARAALSEAQEVGSALVDGSRQRLVRLALAVARRVVNDELAARPGIVARVVEDGLSRFRGEGGVSMRVNPEDLGLLEERRAALGEAGGGPVELLADPAIERGGALIQTGAGEVDCRISTRIEEVEKAVLEVIEGG